MPGVQLNKYGAEKTYGFGLKAFKKFPELIPLATAIGFAVAMGASYSAYSLYQKSDVRLRKSSELPPWERVDPTQPQKLLTYRTKYEVNPELEKLRKEIGSYKC